MALSFAKISVELREILLSNRPEKLYKISPKGTVPVLQTEQKVIDESLDIMFWALDKIETTNNILSNIELQKEMVKKNDNEFKIWLDRYKYNDRNKNFTLEECKSKCGEIIFNYETKLEQNNYLLGNSISFVDIAIFPFIRQFVNVDIKYFSETYPFSDKWLENMLKSELFNSVMKKYPQWKMNDLPNIINFKSEAIEA